jgi:acetate kinase
MSLPKLVLVVNCGSSSLKFSVLPVGGGAPLVSGLAEKLGLTDGVLTFKIDAAKQTLSLGQADHARALAAIFRKLDEMGLLARVAVVGHRVAHGGEFFTASTLTTPRVLADLEKTRLLAPLHNPAQIDGLLACIAQMPGAPQALVFDTAFHQTMPPAAFTYATPQSWYRDFGLRRYGFHGTSHRYVAGEAARILGFDPNDHGLVIAHLGNGGSATAVLNGKSVDTSMGMTPLEGLVMGTRSGDVDFGALAYVARRLDLDVAGLDAILNKQSGLLGLSELSSDCRNLEAAADEGHDGARLALDVYVHRLARHVGALATSLPRLDALVFTGGIGENSPRIRAATLRRLAVFGFTLDADANQGLFGGRSGRISGQTGPIALVVPTDEESMIARDAATLAGLAA